MPFVRAFPDKGGRWQVSSAGGSYPLWSSNGHELFFRTGDNQIMVAGYTTNGDSFVPDKPRLWSEKRLLNFGLIGTASYDIAPDGNRSAAWPPAPVPLWFPPSRAVRPARPHPSPAIRVPAPTPSW